MIIEVKTYLFQHYFLVCERHSVEWFRSENFGTMNRLKNNLFIRRLKKCLPINFFHKKSRFFVLFDMYNFVCNYMVSYTFVVT